MTCRPNQVHPEEEVNGIPDQEVAVGSTSHEPDLEWQNLTQQAEWLVQDNATLAGKLGDQEEKDRRIRYLEEENQKLSEQNEALNAENYGLKTKLSDFEYVKTVKDEALRDLSSRKQEIEILKGLANEKKELERMSESLDADKQREYFLRREMEEVNRELRRQLNEQNDKIQKQEALLDLRSSELNDIKSKNEKLQRKLQILSPEPKPTEDSDEHNITKNGRFKRKRLLECTRCRTAFPSNVPCCVHEKRPLRLNPNEKVDNGLLYWPCCGKEGRQEPEGCKTYTDHVFE